MTPTTHEPTTLEQRHLRWRQHRELANNDEEYPRSITESYRGGHEDARRRYEECRHNPDGVEQQQQYALDAQQYKEDGRAPSDYAARDDNT